MMKGCLDSLYCKKNERCQFSHIKELNLFSVKNSCIELYTTALQSDFCTLKQASLVAQLVKNLPVVQETLVRFLSWEDPLKKG